MQIHFRPVDVGSVCHRRQTNKLSNPVGDELEVAEGSYSTPLNPFELNNLTDGGLTDLTIYIMKGGPQCPSSPLLAI